MDQIHPRFLRNSDNFPTLNNSVLVKDISFPILKNRNSFLARIDPFLNYIGKNDKVDTILNNTVSELENLQIRPNHGMPPTIFIKQNCFHAIVARLYCTRTFSKLMFNALIAFI